MSQSVAEVLILAINALGAGLLMFIAQVIQHLMNEMDELDFKRFMNLLGRSAMTDPFAVVVATLPIIAAVLYFVAFGFGHWWFTAGFVLWLVGSAVTKVTNMPIYDWLADPSNTNPEQLRVWRSKLQTANRLRAWLTLASVVAMACQFGVTEVAIVVAASVVVAIPLVWLSRRSIPGTTARAALG